MTGSPQILLPHQQTINPNNHNTTTNNITNSNSNMEDYKRWKYILRDICYQKDKSFTHKLFEEAWRHYYVQANASPNNANKSPDYVQFTVENNLFRQWCTYLHISPSMLLTIRKSLVNHTRCVPSPGQNWSRKTERRNFSVK